MQGPTHHLLAFLFYFRILWAAYLDRPWRLGILSGLWEWEQGARRRLSKGRFELAGSLIP